jgi:hypothetical protein
MSKIYFIQIVIPITLAIFSYSPIRSQTKPPYTLTFGSHLSATNFYRYNPSSSLDFVIGRSVTCDVTREKERIFLSSGCFISNYNYQLNNHVITYSYVDGGYKPNSSHYEGYRWNYKGAVYSTGLRGSLNFRVSKSRRKIQTRMGLTGLFEHVIYRKLKSDNYVKYTRDSYSSYNPWTQQVEHTFVVKEENYLTSEVLELHKFHPGTILEGYLRLSTSHLKKNEFGLELKFARHITGLMGNIDGFRYSTSVSAGLSWAIHTNTSGKAE